MNCPVHLECNFLGNKQSRESYKSTLSDDLNTQYKYVLIVHRLHLFLKSVCIFICITAQPFQFIKLKFS